MTVEWRGKPVWLLKRSKKMLDDTHPDSKGQLLDLIPAPPASSPNMLRTSTAQSSLRSWCWSVFAPIWAVHRYAFRPDIAPADMGPEWKGGFFCPCHGSRFDAAGRVYKGVPPKEP